MSDGVGQHSGSFFVFVLINFYWSRVDFKFHFKSDQNQNNKHLWIVHYDVNLGQRDEYFSKCT